MAALGVSDKIKTDRVQDAMLSTRPGTCNVAHVFVQQRSYRRLYSALNNAEADAGRHSFSVSCELRSPLTRRIRGLILHQSNKHRPEIRAHGPIVLLPIQLP